MVEENKDHYYPPAREIDLTNLSNKPQQDTTHSGSQTPSKLTEEWYPKFQNGYEIPIEQEVSTSQAYQQGSQLPVGSENNNNEETKQDSKMDN